MSDGGTWVNPPPGHVLISDQTGTKWLVRRDERVERLIAEAEAATSDVDEPAIGDVVRVSGCPFCGHLASAHAVGGRPGCPRAQAPAPQAEAGAGAVGGAGAGGGRGGSATSPAGSGGWGETSGSSD